MVGLLAAMALGAMAQVRDAFGGVLPVTDPAMKKCLNGEWHLKVVEGIIDDTAVPTVDATWGKIPVPGCWEVYGFSKPSYDRALPLTGYYRTTFDLPEEWRGMRICIRFDGVLYGYDLWVNGRQAGKWRSAYNSAVFDITDCIRWKADRQELAMKVGETQVITPTVVPEGEKATFIFKAELPVWEEWASSTIMANRFPAVSLTSS